uniref:Ataxin-10 domain-containing protein n=1 Tax=Timema monikensis TaxID=170555 RepID=A0A7R9EJP8_9NEOP|nr:unnamed protein product [Timema monikensis]
MVSSTGLRSRASSRGEEGSWGASANLDAVLVVERTRYRHVSDGCLQGHPSRPPGVRGLIGNNTINGSSPSLAFERSRSVPPPGARRYEKLITQWAIFSVRNLCEGNPESQALIAGLTQRGTVDSATLREMGITLHQEDDKKIVIMPYKP